MGHYVDENGFINLTAGASVPKWNDYGRLEDNLKQDGVDMDKMNCQECGKKMNAYTTTVRYEDDNNMLTEAKGFSCECGYKYQISYRIYPESFEAETK